MRLPFRRPVLVAALAALAFSVAAPAAHGQATKPEEVFIETPDGLKLSGNWYLGGAGRQSPCVLMLHAWGKNSSTGGWDDLAKELQQKGYSVLSFDFRGHGKSASSLRLFDDPKKFASFPFNQLCGERSIKNPAMLKSLSWKNFRPDYFPYLLNDIAGARRFLDQRNDQGQCNSGQIFIIGDREGASLGHLWMAYEYKRNSILPAMVNPLVPIPVELGGKDVMGGVWLSFRPQPPGSRLPLSFSAWASNPQYKDFYEPLRDRVGMAYVYSGNDATAEGTAKAMMTSVWGVDKSKTADKEKGKYMVDIKNAKNLAGIDLFTKQLNTQSQVIDFIDQTKKKAVNGRDHTMRNPGALPAEVVNVKLLGNFK